jgi:hypothetical protein
VDLVAAVGVPQRKRLAVLAGLTSVCVSIPLREYFNYVAQPHYIDLRGYILEAGCARSDSSQRDASRHISEEC